MVGGEGRGDSRWTCNEIAVGFLGLDGAQDSEEIHQHGTMREFGLVAEAVDFTTIPRDSGEGEECSSGPCPALRRCSRRGLPRPALSPG